jgi:hypothetical protein
VDVYELASCQFDPDHPEPLLGLLKSEDRFASSRGLFLFGEVGWRSPETFDAALAHARHPRDVARAGLMNGMIAPRVGRLLTSRQRAVVLGMAADPFALVRGKVVAFIRSQSASLIEEALVYIDPASAGEHRLGLEHIRNLPKDVQSRFDAALGASLILSTYMFASVECAAIDGADATSVVYCGEDSVAEDVAHQVSRLLARRKPR